MRQRDSADRRHGHSGEGVGTGMTWPPTLPFAQVLSRAREFDRTALGHLYRRYLATVYRYALARIGDSHAAEEVTADTFFAMIESIQTTRASDELGFAAWLLGIARNKVAMWARARGARPTVALPDDEAGGIAMDADPLAIIMAREAWSETVRALGQLTEEQRQVVLYRCILGYSAEDVGKLLDKQPGAVRALQFRALNTLARLLSAQGVTPERRRG